MGQDDEERKKERKRERKREKKRMKQEEKSKEERDGKIERRQLSLSRRVLRG